MTVYSKTPVVMQILPALENGGVERGTIDIAKALQKDDFDPIVVSNGGILTYQLSESGIKHIKINVASKNPFTIYSNIKKISDLIRKHQVDIVHVRSRAPMWSTYFACKRTGAKLVATIHGPYSLSLFSKKPFLPKIIYNSIMLKADAIIVVSNFIKNHLTKNYPEYMGKIPPEKITIIQRGVELKDFNSERVSKRHLIELSRKWSLPDDKKIILMPARFTEWKGHEFLIDSLSKVKSDFCCVLVGSDHGHKEFRKRIEQKIIDLNLGEKVKIVGICKEMPIAYAISHLVICPSIRPEAFGRIAIEAQASNKIIIATKIGGALETVIDNETGFLVEPKNSDQLAEIIDKTLNLSEEESKAMGLAGRKNMEDNFSNIKMCGDTLKVYKSLLSNK